MPHLLSLPPELIIIICRFCSAEDLFSWALAYPHRSDLILDELYSLNAGHDGSSALFWAAQNDIPSIAAKILKHVSDINVISGGSTPFIKAAEFGSTSVVELMIIERPDLDINFQLCGCSALWIAASNGHSSVVQRLLRHPHIQVDHPGRAGLTPFAASVMQGHLEVSQMLWNTGKVDVNHKARTGQTPLLLALERRDEALAHYLLGKPGISLECMDELGNTPINNAVRYDLIPILKLLLNMSPRLADTEDNQRRTPLLIAVENGRRDTVRRLLEAGASPNLADDEGRTPLSSALFHGKLMVQLLLSYGADVNEIDSLDQGVLHKAVIYHCAEVIPTLLEFGADPNLRDARDCTALGIAIDDGYHSAIRYLIAARHVDLNALSGGYPPLTIAIMNDQIATVRLLCAVSKLDPNQLDHDGQTPLNTAIMHHRMDIMNVLLQRQDISVSRIGATESPLCTAVNSDNQHAVQRLLQCKGININDGSLLRAIQMASTNTVDDLLEAGCDVNIRDKCRTSAVMEAAKLGSTEILDRLLQYHEVDINAKDEKGRTALWWAAYRKQEGTFKLLLRDGRISTNRLHHGPRFSFYFLRDPTIRAMVQGTPLGRGNLARRSRVYHSRANS